MSADNLALVLKSKGDLSLENIAIPKPGKNEVLLAIDSVGICGSDIHLWLNGHLAGTVLSAPIVLGHESSATVIQVGEGVTHLAPGDRVAIEPQVPCRMCRDCKSGRYNLCKYGVGCAAPPHNGTISRYYVHAADFCFKLPDNVTFEEGAMLEPLSVAVHACRRAGVGAGDKILITGAGPIGLMNLLMCKAMGASSVCMTDLVGSRLELAKSMGASSVVLTPRGASSEELVKQISDSLGEPPDITIECSGAESSVSLAIKATRSGGTVLLVGHGPASISVPLVEAACKEVDLRGTFRYTNCYPIAISLVSNGQVDLSKMVSHRYKLEEAVQAFETARNPETGAIKVMINCAAAAE